MKFSGAFRGKRFAYDHEFGIRLMTTHRFVFLPRDDHANGAERLLIVGCEVPRNSRYHAVDTASIIHELNRELCRSAALRTWVIAYITDIEHEGTQFRASSWDGDREVQPPVKFPFTSAVALWDAVRQFGPTAIHFLGHCEDGKLICFGHGDVASFAIGASEILDMLQLQHSRVALVVLHACRSDVIFDDLLFAAQGSPATFVYTTSAVDTPSYESGRVVWAALYRKLASRGFDQLRRFNRDELNKMEGGESLCVFPHHRVCFGSAIEARLSSQRACVIVNAALAAVQQGQIDDLTPILDRFADVTLFQRFDTYDYGMLHRSHAAPTLSKFVNEVLYASERPRLHRDELDILRSFQARHCLPIAWHERGRVWAEIAREQVTAAHHIWLLRRLNINGLFGWFVTMFRQFERDSTFTEQELDAIKVMKWDSIRGHRAFELVLGSVRYKYDFSVIRRFFKTSLLVAGPLDQFRVVYGERRDWFSDRQWRMLRGAFELGYTSENVELLLRAPTMSLIVPVAFQNSMKTAMKTAKQR